MNERKEFEMTDEQLEKLLEACKPVAMIMLQCGTPPSPQENANRAWQALGEELGFIWDSVEPCGKGKKFFTAQSTETHADSNK